MIANKWMIPLGLPQRFPSRLRRRSRKRKRSSSAHRCKWSGSLANTGRYYRDAYNLAVAKINEKGGVRIGGETVKLELVILDNQSDINLSVRQYVQLVARDKVNFLLGPFASNFALA